MQELESHTHDWEEFLSQVKRTRKPYLDLIANDRLKVSMQSVLVRQVVTIACWWLQLRSLLRKGVPIQFRMIVWTRYTICHAHQHMIVM